MADLNFLNITDCDAITFNTPTTPGLQYIEYILGSEVKDFTNVDKYTITHSTNCCSPGVTTNVAPRYQFVPTKDSCVAGPPSGSYTFQIAGMNGLLIQSFTISTGGPQAPWPYVVTAAGFTFVVPINDAPGVTTITVVITTISGFEYTVAFDVTQSGVSCDGTIGNIVITYPTLPTNIVSSIGEFATSGLVAPAIGISFTITADVRGTAGNSILITLDNVNTMEQLVANWNATYPANTCSIVYTLGSGYISNTPVSVQLSGGVAVPTAGAELSLNSLLVKTTLSAGTYEVIFCEVLQNATSTCIQNHIFIDCGPLKCEVVNKLVLCVDSNIMDIYNALSWGNSCTDTVTYTEFCALYEILTIILETDGCYGSLDECNCSSAVTIANSLSPIAYPTQSNGNPCSTC